MAEEKPVFLGEGYNPDSLVQMVKGFNPAPLSQAVQQIIQSTTPAPDQAPPSQDTGTSSGNGETGTQP